jgi:acyl-CoA thioester hydrolase
MNFPINLELRIDWSEVDLFGHVNNLAILKYAQAARVVLLEKIGLMQMQKEEKIGPILASLTSQFRKPLFYPGKVEVLSRVDWIKISSFCIHHQIQNQEQEVAAEVQDIIVFYDFIKNTKMNLPERIREELDHIS